MPGSESGNVIKASSSSLDPWVSARNPHQTKHRGTSDTTSNCVKHKINTPDDVKVQSSFQPGQNIMMLTGLQNVHSSNPCSIIDAWNQMRCQWPHAVATRSLIVSVELRANSAQFS